jgi:hypothetical protein
MSRNYAHFATAIWRPEDDFGDLTMPAQWAYFMLGTQPDISAAGVLSLNVRRWSKRARGMTRDVVVEALKELQAAEKVFYDYDTEELLIRTFVKADGGYGNQKRRPVIERAALELESPRLRAALAAELRKLGDEVMTKLADRLSAPYGIAYAAEQPQNVSRSSPTGSGGADATSDKMASSQVDSLSDRPYRFDGVVVTQGLEVVPQPSTRIPQPVPPPADASPAGGQLSLDGMPDKPVEEPSDSDRAFGLARFWMKTRESEGTPVVSSNKGDPLIKLKKLIEPFVENRYTDEEVRAALVSIGESIPSTAVLDRTLSRARNGQQRQGGYPQGHTSTVALRDVQQPQTSTATRRWQQAQSVADQLDEQFAQGGAP